MKKRNAMKYNKQYKGIHVHTDARGTAMHNCNEVLQTVLVVKVEDLADA